MEQQFFGLCVVQGVRTVIARCLRIAVSKILRDQDFGVAMVCDRIIVRTNMCSQRISDHTYRKVFDIFIDNSLAFGTQIENLHGS